MTRSLTALFLAAMTSYAAQFTGVSVGTFDNPRAPCIPPITCSGLGTSVITWGAPATDQGVSGVTFTPSAFDVDAGVRFIIGTVTLENHTLVAGTFPDFFDFTIIFLITNQNATSTIPLKMHQVSTPNKGDPNADADWISLSPNLAKESFFVLEDKSETVELWTSFAPAPGDSVFSSSASSAQPVLGAISYGKVLGPNGYIGPNPAIPEPSTGALSVGSLFALILWARLRKGKHKY